MESNSSLFILLAFLFAMISVATMPDWLAQIIAATIPPIQFVFYNWLMSASPIHDTFISLGAFILAAYFLSHAFND